MHDALPICASCIKADVEPQLGFRRHLAWEMVGNKLDEQPEAGESDGIRMISRRGILGYHEIVTAPTYCGKWLVDENKWRRVKHPYQKQICTNRSGDSKKITRGIAYALRDSSYVLSVTQLMLFMPIPKN